MRFGRKKIFHKKTLEGFTAGLVMSLLIGFVIMPEEWKIFLPMALTASLVELWTGKLDDNLTVPLAAGFVGQMLLFIWQIGLPSFPGPVILWPISWIPF